MNISVVVPCYNEEKIIQTNAKRVEDYLKSNELFTDYEIILVNDGSSDSTKSKIEEIASDSIRAHSFDYNQGRGAAMKMGIELASKDYLIFLDADLSYDVEHIGMCATEFHENKMLDTIVLSPYMKGGEAKNIPFTRLVLSRTANWILSGFFSKEISTVTSMVRAYRTSIIKDLPLLLDGKELHLEILKKLHLKNAKVKEIPAKLIWKEGKARNARLNKKKVAKSAFQHLSYAFYARPSRLMGKLSLLLLLISLYEFGVILSVFVDKFQYQDSFVYSCWLALASTYSQSPHTVIIALTSLFLALQLFFFYIAYNLVKNANDEITAHSILILEQLKREQR